MRRTELRADDVCLVLASDGVWEHMSSGEVQPPDLSAGAAPRAYLREAVAARRETPTSLGRPSLSVGRLVRYSKGITRRRARCQS